MPRFVRGITLTPEERARTGIVPGSSNGNGVTRSHECTVNLPDGRTCSVSYTRISPMSHKFFFHAPVLQRIWIDPRLDGSIAAIEAKAQDIATDAFGNAQTEEQKEMRRRTQPSHARAEDRGPRPVMSAKNADRYAGKYAVCLKLSEGGLLRIGPLIDSPRELPAEVGLLRYRELLDAGQRLAIGICDRSRRRWIEPRFLVTRFPEPAVSPAHVKPKPVRRQRTPATQKRGQARRPASPEEPVNG